MSVADRLRPVRTGRYAEAALLVAAILGVAASTLHWAGLALGGVLVGLVAPSFRRALVHGLYLGIAVLTAFGLYLAALGSLAQYVAMGQVFSLSVAIALVIPVLGAGAVRGLT